MSYLNAYDRWHEHRLSEEGIVESLRDPWHLTVARLLPDLNGLTVLEIGCGNGNFSIWLRTNFPDVNIIGIDISPKALSIAKSRAKALNKQIGFVVADAESLSFADGQFDYVISCECLEHLPSPSEMAREIRRVLKPMGQFILTTENYFNGMLLAWLMAWLRGTSYDSGSGVQPHENFFLFWRVKKLLESSGLKIQHMESNHFQWLLFPRTDPRKLATFDFRNATLKTIFRPFGRHFTFCGHRSFNAKQQ
jgi:SAM-dependent methyltransferase